MTPIDISERDAGYIWDMVRAIGHIQEFTKDVSYDDYISSHLIQIAVERKLEILGEAAGRISKELRAADADIDWKGANGLRNIIIHRYNEVQTATIWLQTWFR